MYEARVGRSWAPDELRKLANPRRDACAAVELLKAGERMCHPLERHCERDHAAAVDAGWKGSLAQFRRLGVHGEHRALHWVIGQAVPLRLPAVGAAEGEHAGVLARAVVVDRRGRISLRAALEVVDRRGRLL